MSDLPPPPPASEPPPPPAGPSPWSQPPPPPGPNEPGGQPYQPSYPSAEPAGPTPARPRVVPAAGLIIGGAVVMIIGTFLPWVTGNGVSLNGWDLADLAEESNDAGAYVFLGVLLAGLGIATLAAGRILAVVIAATVIAAFASYAAIKDVSDDGGIGALGFEIGWGLYLILVAAVASLAGSIWALATRRR